MQIPSCVSLNNLHEAGDLLVKNQFSKMSSLSTPNKHFRRFPGVPLSCHSCLGFT
jgi:hypothetical protein